MTALASLIRRSAAASIALTALASLALAATSFPPLKREPVLDEKLGPAPTPQVIKGARIAFAPSQPTPLHLHPSPVVGVVTKGAFIFQIEGQAPRTIRAGEPFFEPAGERIAKFDNLSADEPAEIVAFYLLDRPDRELIQLLGGN